MMNSGIKLLERTDSHLDKNRRAGPIKSMQNREKVNAFEQLTASPFMASAKWIGLGHETLVPSEPVPHRAKEKSRWQGSAERLAKKP